MIRRMVDFPKQLVIGDEIWTIRFCRVIPDQGRDVLGLCCESEHTIYIRMGQSAEERFKTLIHELCHAVCSSYGIKENHQTIYKLEEPIIRLLLDNGVVL